MATSDAPGRFVEYNDFSLVLVRTRGQAGAYTIEELREVPLDNAETITEALQAVFPEAKEKPVSALVLLRPKQRRFNAAANQTAGEWVAKPEFSEWNSPIHTTISAKDGALAVVKGTLAAMAAASTESLNQAKSALAEWKIEPTRTLVAPFALAGAIAAARQKTGEAAPVLVLDCGKTSSNLLLVSRNGLLAARPVALTLDDIAEAVRSELGLKFKGAATKLFFNENYDFSEAGPRIAAQLAPALKTEIAAMAGSTPPTAFFCAGMPAKQDWFADSLATALELPRLSIDMTAWSTGAGLTLADSSLTLSTTWLGLLHTVSGKTPQSWLAGWGEVAPATSAAPAAAAKPAATAPAATPAAKPAAPVASKPAPAPVNPVKAATAAAAPAPAAPVKPATPAAQPAPAKPAAPAPAPKPAATIKPAPVSTAKIPAPTPKTATAPLPAAKPAPSKPSAVSYSHTPTTVPAAKPPFIKTPAGMGAIAAVIAIIAIGAWLFTSSKSKAEEERLKLQQQTELAEKQAQEAKALAEKQAQERKKTETELQAKLRAAEQAAKTAREEAERQKTARIANARGTLVIKTEPAGATVHVGDLPAQTSPATFTDIKIGSYPVSITLPRYAQIDTTADVSENQTTDLGTLQLQRITCALELACEPAGSSYELKPTALSLTPNIRRGTTPAKLEDLDAGEYLVIFRREGWPDRETRITLEKGATDRVAWAFPRGNLEVTSTPSGAKVVMNGRELGSTPLTARDLPPGEVTLALTLPGFDPISIPTTVVNGQTVAVPAMLTSSDRIVKSSELDEKPMPIFTKAPELPPEQRTTTISVQVSLIVGRDGAPRDLEVITKTTPEIARACLEAAALWRFKPGMVKGRPVNTRVSIPFRITASEATQTAEPGRY